MNIKKLFATLAGVSLFAQTVVPFGALAATYSQELQDAYNWAYGKSITTMSSIDNANMYGAITRAELAKMLANWAKDKGQTPDTSKACTFTDTASVKGDLATAIVEACQLGLMGQGITAFRPYDTISRAEFGTALSRALWGDKYEGGTPYYAKHLDALKAAGIMTQIANAESTKEVRGYVMLMLMRSESAAPAVDCEDAIIKAACVLDSDECPAACKTTEEPEDVAPKSGDLAVTATPAEGRKVLKSGISDLDTLTFATSEEVEISKIQLELYGYTADSDTIKGVWLEDADGNVIADAKTLTKDKVTLAIKKDYRKVDGKFVATIVVETLNAEGTLGFKVVKDGVVSTAANLNVDDYSPYTYEVIAYQGSTVTVTVKGSDKDYNYEEGNSYEIARFKVTAGTKDVLVKGFTLTNKGKLDMGEFLDELTVTVDGKEIKANASVNKDEELVISFNDVAINMNKSALFVLSASFKDFDDYGEAVQYYLADTADFNAVESKNGTRVQVTNNAANGVVHTFNGGKIKLANTKLGNVDAAQASEGNVVAEGKVTITEPISKLSFSVVADANAQYIDTLTLVVNGEDYEAEKIAKAYSFTSYAENTCTTQWATGKVRVISTGASSTTVEVIENSVLGFVGEAFTVAEVAANLPSSTCYPLKQGTTTVAYGKITDNDEYAFGFKNVSIDESGKVQFLADIKDDPAASNKVINFKSNLGKAAFEGARYDNSNKDVSVADVAGSVSFSKVTIQAAKAALENNLTKAVEFLTGETARKVVFDGTYTAKKGEVNLNKVQISGTAPANNVTFYVSIDGEEVTDADLNVEETFSDVKVKANESVKVVVEAEVEGYNGVETMSTFTLELKGTDANGNEDTGRGSDTLVAMEVKASGTTTISAGAAKSTVLLKAKNQTIAEFIVKPSNASDEGLTLDSLNFRVTNAITGGMLRVKVAGVEIDEDNSTALTYYPNEELSSEGVKVEIILKNEVKNTVKIDQIKVNGGAASAREFSKRFEDAVVTVTAQENKGDYTKYTVEVDEYDSTFVVTNLKFYVNDGATCTDADLTAPTTCKEVASLASVEDGLTLEADNDSTTQSITAIKYTVAGSSTPVVIYKAAFEDYFKVGSDTLRVYSNK